MRKQPRILLVAGARPNFMKIAPIIRAARVVGAETVLVHTGQHYDATMSDTFFKQLELPAPDHHLGVGSGSHAAQTARVMDAFEPVLIKERPDWVVVVGDVNSTLACALVAVKLKEEIGCRIAHVEAGLRSGDWRMPEEVNRVLTDRISDLLLTPSEDALPNLIAEGIPAERVVFVGNVMIDTLMHSLSCARELGYPKSLGLSAGRYAVATLHRPSNVDSAPMLRSVLDGLRRVSSRFPLVLPLHPRTRQNIDALGSGDHLGGIMCLEPLGYLEMLALTDGAAVVLTDSGGLQEETTALGVPCITLREQTERPITVTHGTNRLIPWPPTPEQIEEAAIDAAESGRAKLGERSPPGWDGHAAERVVAELCRSTP
ncbi:MAG TPA: UDP-N-acetylglucosamine 2-epimerase (non-hydrolyzing) [Gemmatimonadaceae bacterium]